MIRHYIKRIRVAVYQRHGVSSNPTEGRKYCQLKI